MSKTKKYKDDVKWVCKDCDAVEWQPPALSYVEHPCGGGAAAKVKPMKRAKDE